jgi:tRNA A-37 threonylcarbamoyl transferase component Bud32
MREMVKKMLNIPYGCAFLMKSIKKTAKKWNANRDLACWSSRKSELTGNSNTAIRIEELGLDDNNVQLVRENLEKTRQVVIANIDQDGFFLSRFGSIDGVPCVSQENFFPRKRLPIDLVAIDGLVGIRKHYRDQMTHPSRSSSKERKAELKNYKILFLREIEALHFLTRASCNVPAIMDVDFNACILTFSYIPGKVLREELASSGAILRDRDVDENFQFNQLSPGARERKRIEEGRKYLRYSINEEFIEKLFDQIRKIHSAGFRINDIKYGNIIIEKRTGNPYLIDFESSENLTGLGYHLSEILFDDDIRKFNLLFGTDKPTYQSLGRMKLNRKFLFLEK